MYVSRLRNNNLFMKSDQFSVLMRVSLSILLLFINCSVTNIINQARPLPSGLNSLIVASVILPIVCRTLYQIIFPATHTFIYYIHPLSLIFHSLKFLFLKIHLSFLKTHLFSLFIPYPNSSTYPDQPHYFNRSALYVKTWVSKPEYINTHWLKKAISRVLLIVLLTFDTDAVWLKQHLY